MRGRSVSAPRPTRAEAHSESASVSTDEPGSEALDLRAVMLPVLGPSELLSTGLVLCRALRPGSLGLAASMRARRSGPALPSCKFPSLSPRAGGPSSHSLLIEGTRCSSYLSLRRRFQIPAGSWRYSNKPITSSCGNQGTSRPPGAAGRCPRPGFPLCSGVRGRVAGHALRVPCTRAVSVCGRRSCQLCLSSVWGRVLGRGRRQVQPL